MLGFMLAVRDEVVDCQRGRQKDTGSPGRSGMGVRTVSPVLTCLDGSVMQGLLAYLNTGGIGQRCPYAVITWHCHQPERLA